MFFCVDRAGCQHCILAVLRDDSVDIPLLLWVSNVSLGDRPRRSRLSKQNKKGSYKPLEIENMSKERPSLLRAIGCIHQVDALS